MNTVHDKIFLDRLEAHVGIGTTTLTFSGYMVHKLGLSGNFLGSSTSTGSFGRIQASTIGGNSPLTIEFYNFSVDSVGMVSGSGVTGSFGKLRVGRCIRWFNKCYLEL